MASSVKVRPCPFCGLVPDIDNPATFLHETGTRYAAMTCCIIGPEVRVGFYTPLVEWKDEAIAAWNEQTYVIKLEAEIASLKQQLAQADAAKGD